jgi:hypothetical protein
MRSRVFTDLSDPEVTSLFTDFSYTAFRLNARDTYIIDEETSAFTIFKDTGRVSRKQLAFMQQWADTVVTPAVKAGKRMERVQIWRTDGTYTDGRPGGMSLYNQFQREAFKISSAAGEKIRILTTTPDWWPEDVCYPGIPRDFWLFDSSTLLEMHFNADHTFREAVLQTEFTYPSALIWANRSRDAAMIQSAPFYP